MIFFFFFFFFFFFLLFVDYICADLTTITARQQYQYLDCDTNRKSFIASCITIHLMVKVKVKVEHLL